MVVKRLRASGWDVVTLQELGWGNVGTTDEAVLELAVSLDRCLLTCNRRDFVKLDRKRGGRHSGMIVCSQHADPGELAEKLLALAGPEDWAGRGERVNRGSGAGT